MAIKENNPKKYHKSSFGNSIHKNQKIIVAKSNPPSLICSEFGTIFLNEKRNLYSLGKNIKGFLGHNDSGSVINSPQKIKDLSDIKMLDCGSNHTVCIDFDGYVYILGGNYYGQLGLNVDKNILPSTSIPQKIQNIPFIDSISCGDYFTICITSDRKLYSFGENNYGQLGIGKEDKLYSSPQLIPGVDDVEFIECGGFHTISKTYSGEFYSWGGNRYGQLGQGHKNKLCNKPILCTNWPDDVVDVKCGLNHTLLLNSFGYVYSFGSNFCGQLGIGDKDSELSNIPKLINNIPIIKLIKCGYNYSMCIDTNDKLWLFGNNINGQLGIGDNKNRYKPTLNESLHDIIDISSGGNHTFVKTNNNEIYTFGYNEDSQLGIKTSTSYKKTPTQVFKDNEDIWGANIYRSKQKSARK